MLVKELTEFIRTGEEKALWIVSYKSAGAGILAFLAAQKVAGWLGLHGFGAFGFSIVLAIWVGSLFRQVRGVMYLRRQFVRARSWVLRRSGHAPMLISSRLWAVERPDDEEEGAAPKVRRRTRISSEATAPVGVELTPQEA